MINKQIISILEAELIGMRKAKILLTEFENAQADHYQREHDMLEKRIFLLKSENELGDSGVTCEHGELHDVALSHTHGEGGETPVERPLPSITQAKEFCSHRRNEECIKPSSCRAFGCNKPM